MRKFSLLFPLIALFIGFGLSKPSLLVSAADFNVSFVILNDDQVIPDQVLSAPGLVESPTLISRDNVTILNWYEEESLTTVFDFAFTVSSSMTLYSNWDYLDDEVTKATIEWSLDPEVVFLSGSGTLSISLYAPLAIDVTYQWQMKLVSGSNWEDIQDATDSSFKPVRNGNHEYRVVYRTPVYDGSHQIIDTNRHESNPIWLEAYGEVNLMPLYLGLGFTAILGLVLLVSRKHKILFFTNEGSNIPSQKTKVYEDISLLPIPSKENFKFAGWYLDEELTKKMDIGRMPRKDLKLYAKWTKTKKN